jgi:N-methylhydantoinase A
MLRVGADVGGTFTDIVLADESGEVWKHKTPSTPPHFERAVLEGIAHLLRLRQASATEIAEVAHGTTVATNAVLEHRGARTALVTTKGFRDVLELRRIRAPQMYNLFFEKPKELVDRRLRFELSERMSAAGDVLATLSEAELHELKEKLEREQIESVAVCLLHAYAYPDHERRAGELLRRELPGVEVSLSSEVLRERLEYERTATTVVNAYGRPVMRRYLGAMREGLAEMETRAPLLIMQSAGGLTPEADAAERPVYALESGPAAGVLASLERARLLGLANVISFDMGGTTAKASLIENQEISYSAEYEVGASLSVGNRLVGGGGELIRAPSIDLAEVGAGGGSVAYLDGSGRLRVGPRSAGAVPGPVCYGRGGSEPTITDANVALGYIRPGKLADGDVAVDAEAARRAIYDCIAGPLGMSLLEAADGIHRIGNARIMRALRAVSTERGRDPREFVLMAFGGSGPIHAAPLAAELSIRRTVIPPLPGLFSALGLLSSGVEHHDVRSCLLGDGAEAAESLEQMRAELAERMLVRFGNEGFPASEVSLHYSLDMRFAGQSSELRVPGDSLCELRPRFERQYERLYGHRAGPRDPIEIVAVRLVGRVSLRRGIAFRAAQRTGPAESQRRAWFGGQAWDTPVISRQALDRAIAGPLLIDEYDSTTVVPPGVSARLGEHQDIILEPCHA